ncbi:MAG: hypothetical protein HY043_13085 [Verrucomicrobia bacterium]|nr:hypothetical protein [Verrucomicrobiota bacterium]
MHDSIEGGQVFHAIADEEIDGSGAFHAVVVGAFLGVLSGVDGGAVVGQVAYEVGGQFVRDEFGHERGFGGGGGSVIGGLGLETDEARTYGHGGSAPGMNAILRVYPESGQSVIVLCNLESPSASRMGDWLHARLPLK